MRKRAHANPEILRDRIIELTRRNWMRKLNPEKHEAQRRKILDAARACFARKGFSGTTTSEICAEVGMSPGNLFYYFPNKAALVSAVAEDELRQMSLLFSGIAHQDDVIEAIEMLATELIKLSLDPVYVRINTEIAAEIMRNSEFGRPFAENERHIKVDLISLIQRGIDRGQVDPSLSPESVVTWLIALFDGAMTRAQMDPDYSIERHAPTLLHMLRRFLEAPASSPP